MYVCIAIYTYIYIKYVIYDIHIYIFVYMYFDVEMVCLDTSKTKPCNHRVGCTARPQHTPPLRAILARKTAFCDGPILKSHQIVFHHRPKVIGSTLRHRHALNPRVCLRSHVQQSPVVSLRRMKKCVHGVSSHRHCCTGSG